MKVLILISVIVLLISCSNPTKNNLDISELQDTITIEQDSTKDIKDLMKVVHISDYLKIVSDSVEIPFFEIELKLSKKAEEKLKTDNETVIVSATFESNLLNDEDIILNNKNIPQEYKERVEYGRLYLLSHRIELTDERLVRFENIKFHKNLYDLLEDKDIMLLINVFSGRRSFENNILDCDILYDSMNKIKEKRFIIRGKLIGE
jgi:hypothetical protein